MEYNALNMLTQTTQPDGSVLRYVYDKGGLLQKVLHGATEYITNITYNARGQRENIYYGNTTKTRYNYDPLNFRLQRLLTTRNTGQDVLQDLNYTYDPVGNITEIRDDAQQTEYVSNQAVAPVSRYEYDSLYRLIQATGRELSGIATPSYEDYPYSEQIPGNAVRNYNHTYTYDPLGNMLVNPWRTNVYGQDNNKLLRHDDLTVDQYMYDEHGNMTSMPHLSNMEWDEKNQLISTGDGTFTSYYCYDISVGGLGISTQY